MLSGVLGYRAKWEVRWVPSTGSTNADLLAAARAGAPAGSVLVADHQTAGRGRLGRAWVAPPGSSLLVSLLLRPSLAPAELHVLTRAVGVAAARACAALTGVTPALKWPNDLVVGARKLGGILAESVVTGSSGASGRDGPARDGGRVEAVVVGLGLNVAWPPPAEVPAELRELVVDLRELGGRDVDRAVLLGALLAHLDELDRHPDELDPAYKGLLATLGREVRVHLPDGELDGVAVDVTAAGHLVVEAAGERREISAGDVVHLRVP